MIRFLNAFCAALMVAGFVAIGSSLVGESREAVFLAVGAFGGALIVGARRAQG